MFNSREEAAQIAAKEKSIDYDAINANKASNPERGERDNMSKFCGDQQNVFKREEFCEGFADHANLYRLSEICAFFFPRRIRILLRRL